MANERVSAGHVFELYVVELEARTAAMDETLLVRLKWFAGDIETAVSRLTAEPGSSTEIMAGISRSMQELDTAAGVSHSLHVALGAAKRWGLLLPEAAINED